MQPDIRKLNAYIRRFVVLGAAAYLMLIPDSQLYMMSETRMAALGSHYNLMGWHMENFASKWTHWLIRTAPGLGISDQDRVGLVDRYFLLGDEARRLQDELAFSSNGSTGSDDGSGRGETLARRLDQVRAERLLIRADVEETIESGVSSAVRNHRLGVMDSWEFLDELVFPPIDIRLQEPPKALITSPRDKIERLETVLLEPGITLRERERIERRIADEQDLSAIVLDIGGVATYPASIYNRGDLRGTLRIVAHEWIHHYMAFRPLGSEMHSDPAMHTLNETAANIAGNELGDWAYLAFMDRKSAQLGGRENVALRAPLDAMRAGPAYDAAFDYGPAMRETRISVDRLLAAGQVELAESYMESRRRTFNDNGYPIRKLNQAYFAFNGSYADGPASVDPIGPQVRRLRDLSDDVGEFISLIAEVGSYDEFLKLLERLERIRD